MLRTLNDVERASVGALHRATGLPKPTVVRLLETLIHAGYVAQEGPGGDYYPTARVLGLARGLDRASRLVRLASPILADYRASMPWPSDLAVFDRDAMVIIETNREPGAIALNRSVGTRMPMLSSALGRAFLAFCPDDVRDVAIAAVRGKPDPLVQRPMREPALRRMLARFRRQGFAFNDRELSPRTRGVGVPVIARGTVVACLNTITLAEVLTLDQMNARCVGPLQAAAAAIGQAVAAEMAADTLAPVRQPATTRTNDRQEDA